jgi:hypothetical protein
VFSWNNGKRYEGEWALGKQNGKGVIITETGERKAGIWENGRRIKVEGEND